MKKLLLALVMTIAMVLGASVPGYAGQSPSGWSQVGSLEAGVSSLVATNGTSLYAGTPSGVWSWNGTVWSQVGSLSGDAASVSSLVAANGTLYAGTYGGVWSWNGTAWSQVGSLTGKEEHVSSLVAVNGTLYAGMASGGVWSWNGSVWSPTGSLASNTEFVNCLAAVYGTVYAGMASGGVWSWNGSAWTEVGSLTGNAAYASSLVAVDGTLYAGGSGVWSWNGSAWSPVGSLPGYVITGNQTACLANVDGALYACTIGYGIWSWNGTAWSQVGSLSGYAASVSSRVAVSDTLYVATANGVWSRSIAPATPTVFTDVTGSYWAYADIKKLNSLGYISGYPDGTFRPDVTITRAEFVSVLDKALKLEVYNWAAVPDFSDVSSNDWFYGSVGSSVYAGITKGYGSYFAPNNPITRQELAVILVNAIGQQDAAKTSMDTKTGFSDDTSISPWARGFVAVSVKDGLLKGYPGNSIQPQGNATRAEACTMIVNLLNSKK